MLQRGPIYFKEGLVPKCEYSNEGLRTSTGDSSTPTGVYVLQVSMYFKDGLFEQQVGLRTPNGAI